MFKIKYCKKTNLIIIFAFFILLSFVFVQDIPADNSKPNRQLESIEHALINLESDLEYLSNQQLLLEDKILQKQELIDRINTVEENRLVDKTKLVNFWMMFWSSAVVLFGIILGFFSYTQFKKFDSGFDKAKIQLNQITEKADKITKMHNELDNKVRDLHALYLLDRGIYHLGKEEFLIARKILDDSLRLNQKKETLYYLAETFRKDEVEKFSKAVDYLNQAINMDIEYLEAYHLRSEFKYKLGYFSEAEKDDMEAEALNKHREDY